MAGHQHMLARDEDVDNAGRMMMRCANLSDGEPISRAFSQKRASPLLERRARLLLLSPLAIPKRKNEEEILEEVEARRRNKKSCISWWDKDV